MEKYLESYLEVFGKGLEPYGYKRIKGSRYPYLVRVTPSKEVITFILITPGQKVGNQRMWFEVKGGAMSIYTNILDLKSAPNKFMNFVDNMVICKKRIMDGVIGEEEHPLPYSHMYYVVGSETKPMYAPIPDEAYVPLMEKAFESTNEYMISEFEKITDLKSMMEFYRIYLTSCIRMNYNFDGILDKKTYVSCGCMESICNMMVYDRENFDEYTNKCYDWCMESCQKRYEKNPEALGAKEKYEEGMERFTQNRHKEIDSFRLFKTDPKYIEILEKEKTRRKEENLSYLRKLGVEI